jgi:FkbM family methyltransferase
MSPLMVDALQVLSAFQADSATADTADTVAAVLRGDPCLPCYALGRNEHAEQLLRHLAVQGMVDDFAASGSTWHGLPVLRAEEVPIGACVINCAMSIAPITASARIRALPQRIAIEYADLCRATDSPVPLPAFVTRARALLNDELPRFEAVFARLADSESKAVFNQLMAYRLTADPAHMQGFRVRLREQYFEPFLGDLSDVTLADCGGYDGDTTELFVERYPDYRRIYFFEPSAAHMQRARTKLAGIRDLVFIESGLSNEPGNLQFDANAGSASAISSAGGTRIEVTTLDACVKAPLGFIKMDVEGWEHAALQGARRHIREEAPSLAIAVYHDIADFYRIPEYVLALQPSYDIRLRHYTEGWSETVMYFVPRAA